MSAIKAQHQKWIIVALLGVGLVVALMTPPSSTEPNLPPPLNTTPVSLSATPAVQRRAELPSKPMVRPASRIEVETMIDCNPFQIAKPVSVEVEEETVTEVASVDPPPVARASGALMAVYGSGTQSRALVGAAIVREGDRLESGESILQIESRSIRLGVAQE